jgi:hypothetical protein
MKRLLKEFHRQMVIGCQPFDTTPVYILMIIALICPLFYIFK